MKLLRILVRRYLLPNLNYYSLVFPVERLLLVLELFSFGLVNADYEEKERGVCDDQAACILQQLDGFASASGYGSG
ncbi:hypothetical protein BKA66DRAFT_472510 [Pyrenochaeta sp. MPI-SDFR-AT-0127]|nr:hypothetical protein BKA66DRAFT_472510 [Pyrenochaeta sp. MPI-SDFR-AT-0127]